MMEKVRQKHKKVTKIEGRARNTVYKTGKERTITGRKACFTL